MQRWIFFILGLPILYHQTKVWKLPTLLSFKRRTIYWHTKNLCKEVWKTSASMNPITVKKFWYFCPLFCVLVSKSSSFIEQPYSEIINWSDFHFSFLFDVWIEKYHGTRLLIWQDHRAVLNWKILFRVTNSIKAKQAIKKKLKHKYKTMVLLHLTL